MKTRKGIFLLVILIEALCFTGCATQQTEENIKAERNVFTMNTYMTFTAYGENAEIALEEATSLVEELEALWSVTNKDSEIYKANHNNGQPEMIRDETEELIRFALEISKKTDGTLEPTIYPVLTAWGFTTDNKQVPQAEEITELLKIVDYSRIELNEVELTIPEGMQLDLGAVAKGYTADLITVLLKEQGVHSAILSLGGNIQAIGSRPDGSDWRVGIRAPWENDYLGVLEISDAAVVTSGGYENYFEDENGNIYWHILDPATGYPANSGVESVTVIGTEGRLCDALSTALFVMGAEEAEAYWRENGGFDMILVTDEHEVLITEGIADQFALSDGRMETVRVLEQ